MGNQVSSRSTLPEIFTCRDEDALNNLVQRLLGSPLWLSNIAGSIASVSANELASVEQFPGLRHHSMEPIEASTYMNWYFDRSHNLGNPVVRKYNDERYPKTMKGSLTMYKDNVYEATEDITSRAGFRVFDPPDRNESWALVLEKAGGKGVMALIVSAPLCTSDLLYCDGHDYLVLSCQPWKDDQYRVFVAKTVSLPNGWLRSKHDDDTFQKFRREFGLSLQATTTKWIDGAEVKKDVPPNGNKDFDFTNKVPCKHAWFRYNLPCFPVAPILFCDTIGDQAICRTSLNEERMENDLYKQHEENKKAWFNACTGLLLKWWALSSRTARFFIVFLDLADLTRSDHALHANMLLLDKQSMTCTRIESHGKNPLYDGRTDKAIARFLKEQTMFKGRWMEYQSVQSRPEVPLFQIQYSNNLCASWSLYAVLQALRIQIEKEREGKPLTILQSTRMAYGTVVTDPIRLVRFWAYYFGVAMQKGHIANRFSPYERMEGFVLQHLPKLSIYFNKHFFKFFIRNAWETNRENFDRLFPNIPDDLLAEFEEKERAKTMKIQEEERKIQERKEKETQYNDWKNDQDKLDQKVSDAAQQLNASIQERQDHMKERPIVGGGSPACANIRFKGKGRYSITKSMPQQWTPPESREPFAVLRNIMRELCIVFEKIETLDPLISRGIPSCKALIALLHTGREKYTNLPYGNKALGVQPQPKKMSYSKSMIDMTILGELHKFFQLYKNVSWDDFVPEDIRKYEPFQEYVKQVQACSSSKQNNMAYNVWFFNQIEPESFTDIVFDINYDNETNIRVEDIVFSKEGAYMPDNGYSLLKKTDSESFKENGNDFLIRHMVAHMKYKYTCVEGVGSIFLKANGTPWLTESNMFAPMEKGYYGADILETVLQLPFTECVRKHLEGSLIATDTIIRKCRRRPKEILKMVLNGTDLKRKQVYSMDQKDRESILRCYLKYYPRFDHRLTLNYVNENFEEPQFTYFNYLDKLQNIIIHDMLYPKRGEPVKESVKSIEDRFEAYSQEKSDNIEGVDAKDMVLYKDLTKLSEESTVTALGIVLDPPKLVEELSEDDAMHILRHLLNLEESKEGSLGRILLEQCSTSSAEL